MGKPPLIEAGLQCGAYVVIIEYSISIFVQRVAMFNVTKLKAGHACLDSAGTAHATLSILCACYLAETWP
jgi:hypothetical protein